MKSEALLTTVEIALELRVHPKHVYRLLRQGLPGRRLGGQWRFVASEVHAWMQTRARTLRPDDPKPRGGTSPAARGAVATGRPPLIVANGDVVVERLLEILDAQGAGPAGLVLGDCGTGFAKLQKREVLVAGAHGESRVDPGYARIELALREVGIVARSRRPPALAEAPRLRWAARPSSAPMRKILEQAIRGAGATPSAVLRHAPVFASHRDVVLAIVRGEVDAGVTTRAWAERAGLSFRALTTEVYGFLVAMETLADPFVARLFETVQSAAARRLIEGLRGYDAAPLGRVVLGAAAPAGRPR